ncbi:MSH2 protein [Savitreella phatthalungensis]
MADAQPAMELDSAQEDGFCSFFNHLPAKDDNVCRIFDRNGFYSAHGSDAVFIARTVYKTQTVLKHLGNKDPTRGLASVTMSHMVMQSFVRDCLANRGMRIEIWRAEKGSRSQFRVAKVASPGNLQDVEDIIYGSAATAVTDPVLMAVKLSIKDNVSTVGTCFTGANLREIGLNEFVDDELFSNFESMVIQCGVKECLVQAVESYEMTKLTTVLERCDIVVTTLKNSEFSDKDVRDDLTRLLGDDDPSKLAKFDLNLACGAANALLRYLSLMSDASNFATYKLSQYDLSQYMRLDASALRALSLMPAPQDGAKTMSVFGLLNKAKTPLGQRLLGQWLKQPLVDVDEIRKRHDLVEYFCNRSDLCSIVQQDHLKYVPDLYRLSKKFKRSGADLQDVVRLYQVVIRLPGLTQVLQDSPDHVRSAFVTPIDEQLGSLSKFADLVETTVDLDALDRHEFLIKPEFDENLRILKERISTLEAQLHAEHEAVGNALNADTDKKLKLEQHSTFGYCLRLTRLEASSIRGKREYSELQTSKAGVYFTTTKLSKLSREYGDASQQYGRHQTGLVREVVTIAASYCPVVERLGAVVATLDVILAFASTSILAPTQYVRPTMHAKGEGDVMLVQARHPCIEAQDDVTFIPNDVELRRGDSEFLIITGANMGGKSTYIRQIGVIALLAQIGCFVPCTSAELTVFDSILARVGAGDSQLKGVSTFMAEMLETATILRSATRDSLIIIDELGRGTSTTDGFGIAWAISQYIVERICCFGLFATHFHELTDLAKKVPTVKNLHVEAHIDTTASPQDDTHTRTDADITLLYRVAPGVSDQSFGIHVAELAKLPPTVIAMAKRKAEELAEESGDPRKHARKDGGDAVDDENDDTQQGQDRIKQILDAWRARALQLPPDLPEDQLKSAFREIVDPHREFLSQNAWYTRVTQT